jgi:hypothetical protein
MIRIQPVTPCRSYGGGISPPWQNVGAFTLAFASPARGFDAVVPRVQGSDDAPAARRGPRRRRSEFAKISSCHEAGGSSGQASRIRVSRERRYRT